MRDAASANYACTKRICRKSRRFSAKHHKIYAALNERNPFGFSCLAEVVLYADTGSCSNRATGTIVGSEHGHADPTDQLGGEITTHIGRNKSLRCV